MTASVPKKRVPRGRGAESGRGAGAGCRAARRDVARLYQLATRRAMSGRVLPAVRLPQVVTAVQDHRSRTRSFG